MAKGWTFQRLIDEKMKLTACCHHAPCNHHQLLDLVNLRDRFGADGMGYQAKAEMQEVREKAVARFIRPTQGERL